MEGVCPLFHFYNIVLFSASECWPMNFYVCGEIDGLCGEKLEKLNKYSLIIYYSIEIIVYFNIQLLNVCTMLI